MGDYLDNSSPTEFQQGVIDTLSGGTWSAVQAPLPANHAVGSRQGLIESIGISSPPPSCPGGFAITTASPLPSATHGNPYTMPLSGCGGTPPYKFKKIGKLPKGLRLSHSGVISGTPVKPGSATFTVRVTDKAKPKHSVTQSFSLTVN